MPYPGYGRGVGAAHLYGGVPGVTGVYSCVRSPGGYWMGTSSGDLCVRCDIVSSVNIDFLRGGYMYELHSGEGGFVGFRTLVSLVLDPAGHLQ